MKLIRASAGLAALAAAIHAAAAMPGGPPAEKVGAWEVGAIGLGHCSIERQYADGTRVSLSRGDRDHHAISVHNRAWPQPSKGAAYRMILDANGARQPLSGDPHRTGSFGLYFPVTASVAAAIVAGDALEILRPDGKTLARYDLGGAPAAAARLPACIVIATEHARPVAAPPSPPPPPPRPPGLSQARRASPNIPLHSVVSLEDYPPAALAAREEGTVRLRLGIDEARNVASCTVTSSSGSHALDSGTCRLLRERLRFAPARDGKGKAVTDSIALVYTWRLPAPEPPPPPPPPE